MIKIEDLFRLEIANPREIEEYCYYDGCNTKWGRKDIDSADIKQCKIPYYCRECESKIYYDMKMPERREE